MPSMPGAPPLTLTRRQARLRLPQSKTRSSRSVECGADGAVVLPSRSCPFGFIEAAGATGVLPGSDVRAFTMSGALPPALGYDALG